MTDALWYFGRGSGVVSLVLLTLVVVLGIGARSGRTAFGLPRFAVNLLHRNASLLAVVFVAGHVLALLFDPYAQLRVFDLVLPFAGNYRPLWQGLGTLAVDLLIAIGVTSLLRHRLGARAWRAVHWLAYLCWPVALMHGLGTGTDRGTWWLWTIATTCAATVVTALCWRLAPNFVRHPQRADRLPSSDENKHRMPEPPTPRRPADPGRPTPGRPTPGRPAPERPAAMTPGAPSVRRFDD